MNKEHHDLSNFKGTPSYNDSYNDISFDEIRTSFQRDRDRILYCKAFRRLARKTQVFFSGHDDHIRTRLTHTLEVSQISRTISEYLGLDNDLTEAIALGHDIGHAPFGHVGERVINLFSNGCESYKDFNIRATTQSVNTIGIKAVKAATDPLEDRFMGFKHNWQAVRIVEDLARHKRNEIGLGLTQQTLFGILFHTKLKWDECKDKYGEYCKLRERGRSIICKDNNFSLGFYESVYSRIKSRKYFTLEAAIVAMADEIAQRHHDMEDGLRFSLVNKDELLALLLETKVISDIDHSELEQCDGEVLINSLSSILVSFYVMKSINYIIKIVTNSGASYLSGFIERFDCVEEFQELFDISKVYLDDVKVKSLLKHRVLYSYQTQGMDGRAEFMLRRLFKAYISNPQQLPDSTIKAFFRIYLTKAMFINIKDLMGKLNVSFSSITQQEQIDKFSSGQLREILKFKHTKGRHVYKGCLLRAICDLVSGMTDHRAQVEYNRLYGVES